MQNNVRLRVFAGPNGSGKSTLFNEFKKKYDPGYFINADDLERQLNQSGLIDLLPIGIKATQEDLDEFSKTNEAKSLFDKAHKEGAIIDIQVKENFIVDRTKETQSYEASFAASFIRWLLIKKNKSFSFETVMSHPSKVDLIRHANNQGYKTYLYFICTDDPEINVERVANRVQMGGHDVREDKIRSRYTNTLKNLFPAIKLARRAYLFDNSGKKLNLIAEVYEGKMQLKMSALPQWFKEFVFSHYKA